MNKNEWGNTFRLNVSEDISANTNTLVLISRSPDTGGIVKQLTLTVADGLTVPAVPIVINGETYNANEYVEYVFIAEDMSVSGTWESRVYTLGAGDTFYKITGKEATLFSIDP